MNDPKSKDIDALFAAPFWWKAWIAFIVLMLIGALWFVWVVAVPAIAHILRANGVKGL